jgi:hypothetical protein
MHTSIQKCLTLFWQGCIFSSLFVAPLMGRKSSRKGNGFLFFCFQAEKTMCDHRENICYA